MKIIDILNKIANGEEVPKKIKVFDREYEFFSYNNTYRNKETLGTLGQQYSLDGMLNDEVEIIEDTPKEDKKIEKLDYHTDNNDNIVLEPYEYRTYPSFGIDPLTDNEEVLARKINEIIEVINNGK